MTAFRKLVEDLRVIRKDFTVFRWICQLLQNLVDDFRRRKKTGEAYFMVRLIQKALKGFRRVLRGGSVFDKLLLHPGRICGNGSPLCLLGISGHHDHQFIPGF